MADEPNFTLPQAEIRRRLMALKRSGKGRVPAIASTDLLFSDVAVYIGTSTGVISGIAHGMRAMTAQDQLRLSNLLMAVERGELAKVDKGNGRYALRRTQKARAVEVARMGIELGPHGPRFKRMDPV
jgi:hypothetical protein